MDQLKKACACQEFEVERLWARADSLDGADARRRLSCLRARAHACALLVASSLLLWTPVCSFSDLGADEAHLALAGELVEASRQAVATLQKRVCSEARAQAVRTKALLSCSR